MLMIMINQTRSKVHRLEGQQVGVERQLASGYDAVAPSMDGTAPAQVLVAVGETFRGFAGEGLEIVHAVGRDHLWTLPMRTGFPGHRRPSAAVAAVHAAVAVVVVVAAAVDGAEHVQGTDVDAGAAVDAVNAVDVVVAEAAEAYVGVHAGAAVADTTRGFAVACTLASQGLGPWVACRLAPLPRVLGACAVQVAAELYGNAESVASSAAHSCAVHPLVAL